MSVPTGRSGANACIRRSRASSVIRGEGIRVVRKCILALSPNFLNNTGWSKAEFNAVTEKHINSGGSVILPIWHNVSYAEVFGYSPLIADITAIPSTLGIDEMARRLFLEIRPTS
jgi:hypothetical protein